MGLLMGF